MVRGLWVYMYRARPRVISVESELLRNGRARIRSNQ
jgi:hypothetical protein